MAKKPRIVVVGSANTDMLFTSNVVPRGGETVFGTGFDMGFGGKGANQAVAASLCGADVDMIAAVGGDTLGTETVRNFTSIGVRTSGLRVIPDTSTGAAMILVTPDGENRIIVASGANDLLRPADVDAAASLLAGADMVLLQFEVPLETVYHTIRLAKKHKVRCMVNPAPALRADASVLALTEYLILNETEAEVITGREVQSEADLDGCVTALLDSGIRRVILTLGSRGAVLASHSGRVHVPPFRVSPVDTTGAGDAFIGSLAVFLSEGMPDEEAVSRANLYAALSTTRIGTQKSFVKRAEFEAELARRRSAAGEKAPQ
ncbi:MAG TPA: ribokinase [Steroidobacteraceae bacterium]|nr:ribokinase [Steroidobacteraceae bacterium]